MATGYPTETWKHKACQLSLWTLHGLDRPQNTKIYGRCSLFQRKPPDESDSCFGDQTAQFWGSDRPNAPEPLALLARRFSEMALISERPADEFRNRRRLRLSDRLDLPFVRSMPLIFGQPSLPAGLADQTPGLGADHSTSQVTK